MADLGFKEISIEPVVGKEGDYLLKEEDLPVLFEQYGNIAAEYIAEKLLGKPLGFITLILTYIMGLAFYKDYGPVVQAEIIWQ